MGLTAEQKPQIFGIHHQRLVDEKAAAALKVESETKCMWKESEARIVAAAAATKEHNPTPPR